MVAIPKPPKPKIDRDFWNNFFMLEMAEQFIVNGTRRCSLNVGPSITAIGLKGVKKKRKSI